MDPAVERLVSAVQVHVAIREMWVRGAPLLGATAAYGLALQMRADGSDAALEGAKLDDTFTFGEKTTSVRWMWQHLVEEYARHNGHADLLREAIDGSAGC